MHDAIRLASPADRDAVEGIVHNAYQPWVGQIGTRPAPMDADYATLIAAGSVYVTGTRGKLDGVIVLVPEPDALLIDNVGLRPDRQGHGIERSLLAFAEARAQHLGLAAIRLYTHAKMTSNIRLYEALGYAVTKREPIGSGQLVHLRKQLRGDRTASGP